MNETEFQKRWRDISYRPVSIASIICVSFGLLSVLFGPDNNWDLRFYHLYAPWAYLQDRYTYDIGPAQLQGYFNPAPDFLFYSLISSPLNDFPRVIAFIMGAVHGTNAVLILAIAQYVIRPGHMLVRTTLQGMALLIGVTGAGFISLIGLTTGDLLNSIFLLASLLALLKIADSEIEGRTAWNFAFAGLLAGIGLGLKYTSVVFMPGLVLVAVSEAIRKRNLSGAITFGAMLLTGLLLTAGHHMLVLWESFGNPFFPSLNNIFQSPAFDFVSLRDPQFLPRSVLQTVAYPFFWSVRNVHVVSELPFRDWRGAMAYVAIVVWCAVLFVRYMRRPKIKFGRGSITRNLGIIILFVVVSYFAWALGFSIYRYAVTLEMLTGVVVIGVLVSVVNRNGLRVTFATALLLVAIATTQYLDWGRGVHASRGIRPAAYADKYIDIRVPPLPKHSIVLLATGQPAAYFIPYAEPSARYLGIENNFLKLSQDNKLVAEIKRLMRTPGPPKFIVSVGTFKAHKLNDILRHFDLKLGSTPCRPITSNLEEHPLSLCPTTSY
jgi:hypothetical protein